MSDAVSQERTRNYVRQIKGSAIFKGMAVAASFFSFPLMIHYLGQEQFGVFSTLLSVMSWVVFFDLGIGNGLRYKVAESLAKNKIEEAASYISSGYSLIGLIAASLFVLVALGSFYIPWQAVFNTHSIREVDLQHTVLLVAFFVLFNFWIGLVNQIIDAVQKSSVVIFGQFATNLLALIFVFALIKTTEASIFLLAISYGFSLVLTNSAMNFWFFHKRKDLVPKLSIERKHARPLLSLGGQYFVIQLAVLILYSSDKIIVTQLIGPESVTQYDAVFKLFSIISLAFSLMTAPLASAYSDAYHRQDLAWIKQTLKLQFKIIFWFSLAALILIVLATKIITLWIGAVINPPISLIISMGIFVLIFAWSVNFAYVLNATGKIKMQLYLAVFSMLANIPLAILLVKYFEMGSSGVVWANNICMLPFAVLGPMQVFNILRNAPQVLK